MEPPAGFRVSFPVNYVLYGKFDQKYVFLHTGNPKLGQKYVFLHTENLKLGQKYVFVRTGNPIRLKIRIFAHGKP